MTVTLLGTPAEEGGGGKILLLERGAFDGLHAAMMVHPAAVEMAAMPGTAVSQFEVTYTGKPAHAGAYPDLGVNAADAILIAQVAIGQLRQQTRGTDRIQGIVTDAGTAVNVIPDSAAGRWIVRSDTAEALATLTARVKRCFEAGALATGCAMSITPSGPDYADLRPDATLLALYRANAEALGRSFPDLPDGMSGAATTWVTSLTPCPPFIPCSAWTVTPRSTTNLNSPPPASVRQPTEPFSTEPSQWPGPQRISQNSIWRFLTDSQEAFGPDVEHRDCALRAKQHLRKA